jgi:hypothetical protein
MRRTQILKITSSKRQKEQKKRGKKKYFFFTFLFFSTFFLFLTFLTEREFDIETIKKYEKFSTKVVFEAFGKENF